MRKVILLFSFFAFGTLMAQEEPIDINPNNSWFKLGLNAAVPIGDAADFSSFALGLDVRGQYLVTPHFGIGIASGYNHYFAKDDFDEFGIIPLAGFARYYFQKEGVFIGADLGYGFLTNVDNNSGGLYVSPQVGYHNPNWNIYAYYQHTFADNEVDIQAIGVGVTYNIRFK
jgi:hypothetical protein